MSARSKHKSTQESPRVVLVLPREGGEPRNELEITSLLEGLGLEVAHRVTQKHTPLDSPHSGAIGLFNVDGIETPKLHAWLFDKHRIVTTPIVHPEFHGLRITPNVYTSPDQVDLFAEKVLEAIRKGVA